MPTTAKIDATNDVESDAADDATRMPPTQIVETRKKRKEKWTMKRAKKKKDS